MRGIYVFAVTFLTLWTVIAATKDFNQGQYIGKSYEIFPNPPTICPYPEKPNHTTNLPHETDCTKFYKCHVTQPILQDCPLMIPGDNITRLHYNRREQVCDWPWRAGCITCHPKDENGVCPRDSDSKISHEKYCNRYYECRNCIPRERTCDNPKMCFSRTCQKCVWNREGGRCSNGGGGCNPGDRRCHDSDCGKYLECDRDGLNWIVGSCTRGFYYHPSTKSCQYPRDVDCRLCEHNDKCKLDDLSCHECDCGKYYKCQRSGESLEWIKTDCNNGLKYNFLTEKCQDASEVDCSLCKNA